MRKRILLVEDDKGLGVILRDNLKFEGFDVEWCQNGDDVMPTISAFTPHLVLLDLMLPGADGIEICKLLTSGRRAPIPIIMLTARGEPQDKIRGLMSGADDYVTKPFAFEELRARIHALLRRAQGRVESIRLGDAVIDFRRMRAFRGKVELMLTDREFELLRHLSERKGEVVARDELLRLIWGYSDSQSRTVDNFVFRLRQKIERDPKHPQHIHTVYGDGYRLTVDDED
jgi:DNA-binding response OmpR family regulator